MSDDNPMEPLVSIFTKINNSNDLCNLLSDLCTPAELKALNERLKVVALLAKDKTYREIGEELQVSTTTVTRVARCFSYGKDGYKKLIEDKLL